MFLTAPPAHRTTTLRSRLQEAEALLRSTLEQLADTDLVGALSGDEAMALLHAASRVERCAAGIATLAVPALPDDTHFKTTEHHSTARWLAAVRGSSVSDARATLQAGAELPDHPHTHAAVAAGLLSRHQTPEITAALAVDPTAEADLLHAASTESLHHLRGACDRVKAAAAGDDEARHTRSRHQRGLTLGARRDGCGAEIRGNGPADQAALVLAALRQHHQAAFDNARSRHERPSYQALMWDALVAMAHQSLGHPTPHPRSDTETARTDTAPTEQTDDADQADTSAQTEQTDAGHDADRADHPDMTGTSGPGEPTDAAHSVDRADQIDDDRTHADESGSAAPPAGVNPPAKPRRSGAAVEVIVRIDYTALVRGHTIAGETCDIAGVGPVPVTAIRDILATGDPFLAGVITKGQQVCGVVRYGRRPDTYQQTALRWLHPTCAAQGCDNTVIQWDHNLDFSADQRTVLENIDGLCGPTHQLKTHHGWRLVPGTGRRAFVAPTDPRHPGDPTHHPQRPSRPRPPP